MAIGSTGLIAVVVRQPDGSQAIQTMKPDGSAIRTIVHNRRMIGRMSWSPDGSRLAFADTAFSRSWPATNIFVVDADGSGLTQITHATDTQPDQNIDPTWSPDGSQIAFSHAFAIPRPNEAPNHKDWSMSSYLIWFVRSDGSGARPMTPLYPGEAGEPGWGGLAWSPSGSRIAASRDEDPPGLYTMAPDGKDRLLEYACVNVQCMTLGSTAWSPDGNWIAFVRTTVLHRDGAVETRSAIMKMHPNGTDVQTVFACTAPCVRIDGGLGWSPDGRRLVFAYVEPPNDPNGEGSVVATIGSDGRGIHRITTLARMASEPAWGN